jgi:hypothetical protein
MWALLITKQMINIAHERDDLYPAILQSTKGVLFLATPHGGSHPASMLSWLTGITKIVSFGQMNNQLLEALKSQAPNLLEISQAFVRRGHDLYKIYSFSELEKLYGQMVCTSEQHRPNH